MGNRGGYGNGGPGAGAGEVAAVGAACVFVFIAAHAHAFGNQFLINDDARQQLFWMLKWRDPSLYPSPDLLTEYARLYVSPGIKGLYWLASFLFDPLLFSKILTGLLHLCMGVCLFLCGFRIGGRGAGWCAAAVYLLWPYFLHNISGGLARGFAGPSICFFLLSWLRRSEIGVSLSLLVQALFIPYVFLPCSGALVAALAGWKVFNAPRPVFLTRIWHYVLLGAAGGGGFLFGLEFNAAGFGPLAGRADMIGKAVFSGQGRFHVFPLPPVWSEVLAQPLEGLLPFRDGGAVPGVLAGLVLAWLVWRGYRGRGGGLLDRESLAPILYLALSSLVFYAAARVFALKLFVPSRYVEYTVRIIICLGLGLVLSGVCGKGRGGAFVGAGLIILCALAGGARLGNHGLYDYSGDAGPCLAARQTPQEAVFAGHPFAMDNILTFGRRRVFASFELAHPWSMGYWARIEPRLKEFFTAYYSSDPEEVRDFCRRNRIDFLVVDERHFQPDFIEKTVYRVPFYRVAGLPKFIQDMLAARGVDYPVEVQPPGYADYPCQPPFFAPFNALVKERAAASGGRYCLLENGVFPLLWSNGIVRIFDMRWQAVQR